MTTLEFLKKQIVETRSFTNRLIAEMPEDLWFETPEGTNSNFAWQIGHITLAQNYHIVSCAFGQDEEILEKIPLKEFAKIFGGLGSPDRSVSADIITASALTENFGFIFGKCVEKLNAADSSILQEPLEPTLFKNPIADVKYEAISWSFKHEMWHCAEMEQVKVLLGRQFQWLQQ